MQIKTLHGIISCGYSQTARKHTLHVMSAHKDSQCVLINLFDAKEECHAAASKLSEIMGLAPGATPKRSIPEQARIDNTTRLIEQSAA